MQTPSPQTRREENLFQVTLCLVRCPLPFNFFAGNLAMDRRPPDRVARAIIPSYSEPASRDRAARPDGSGEISRDDSTRPCKYKHDAWSAASRSRRSRIYQTLRHARLQLRSARASTGTAPGEGLQLATTDLANIAILLAGTRGAFSLSHHI